jgi:hypothetical protein
MLGAGVLVGGAGVPVGPAVLAAGARGAVGAGVARPAEIWLVAQLVQASTAALIRYRTVRLGTAPCMKYAYRSRLRV